MAGAPIRVLYIDDHPLDRDLVGESLRRDDAPFDLVEAAGRREAEAELSSKEFDLVLTELELPGFRELEAVQTARHHAPATPVVILTGAGSESLALGALRHGAADYIVKSPQSLTRLPVTLRRILEEQSRERARREAETQLSELFSLSGELLLIASTRGPVLRVNPAAERILGYRPAELSGPRPLRFVHPDDRPAVYATLRELRQHGERATFECRLRHRDGGYRWLAWTVSGKPEAQRLYAAGRDITDRMEYEEQLAYQTSRDPVTGLANRRVLLERLDHTLQYARRSGEKVAVVLLDLDNFRIVNDTLGHGAGDMLLNAVATRLQHVLEVPDTLARQGGDEFVAVVNGVSGERDATRVCRDLMDALAEPLALLDQTLSTSASAGVALAPQHGESAEALLRSADLALYRAKGRGRNTYAVYRKRMDSGLADRLELETRLRRALDNDELSLVYQPQIDLRDGRVVALEALLRWHSPELGTVPPGRFVPIAEETGLIEPIGRWVLETACADYGAWRSPELPPVSLAVNLSSRQFRGGDLAVRIAAAMRRAGIPAGGLELELTEGTLMRNTTAAIRAMERLREMGVKLALDDFGTGYSSLSYLHRFPLDKLKIDQAFVRELDADGGSTVIADTVIAMGSSLGLQVAAEGVETEAQLEYLRQRGCQLAQGYWVAPALEPAGVPELLRTWAGRADDADPGRPPAG